jgi:hypothetical protein
MNARDITLGWVVAFGISMVSFLYTGVTEAIALAAPAPEFGLQLPPLLIGVYAAIVGTGLLVGSRFARTRRALQG